MQQARCVSFANIHEFRLFQEFVFSRNPSSREGGFSSKAHEECQKAYGIWHRKPKGLAFLLYPERT